MKGWFNKQRPILKKWTQKQQALFSAWSSKQWKKFKEWVFKKPTPETSTTPGTGLVSGLSLGKYFYGSIVLIVLILVFFSDFSWMRMSFPTINMPSNWIIGIIVLSIVIALLFFFGRKGSLRGTTSWIRGIGPVLGYLFLGVMFVATCVFIWNMFAVSINRWNWDIDPASVPASRVSIRSTINDAERARQQAQHSAGPVVPTRPVLEMNTYQLLKAGTKYQWNRACATEYYFRIKEKGRVGLEYHFDDNSTLYYKGTMIKDAQNARFVPDQGQEEPFVAGTYTVTVDKDALVKFIAVPVTN